MPWTGEPGGGFSSASRTWLPFGSLARNVADQRRDPGSTLHLVRDLIALRREREELRSGAYGALVAPDGAWAYRRGERLAVALNLSAEPVAVDGLAGVVLLASDRARDGERVSGTVALGPWEAAVIELSEPDLQAVNRS
jgi:glycosidase